MQFQNLYKTEIQYYMIIFQTQISYPTSVQLLSTELFKKILSIKNIYIDIDNMTRYVEEKMILKKLY